MNKPGMRLILASLLVVFTTPAVMADGQWKYTTGVDYSTGDYGDDPVDTDITYLPFTASYTRENWTFKGTAAWLEIEGAGTVVGAGDGGVVIGNSGNVSSTTESGLGDIWLSAMYSLSNIPPELLYLDVGAKLKIPTADEDKGLGTGEIDYSLQADLFKPLGKATPFATVAYKIKGDPDGVDLDNVLYLSLGSDFKLSDETNVGASMDYQEASTSSSDDALELFGYVKHKLDQQWSITLYGYQGLDDGSPDYGLGIQLAYKPQN